MKIVQLSDTHISHLGGATTENLERIIALINRIEPAFVVHSGDVAILDPDSEEDRNAAARLLAGIRAPLRVLPGNHDVGEGMANAWAGLETTSERLAAFVAVFGDDHWVELVGAWAVIGLDSEVMGSGLPEEAAQWAWLEGVPELVGERPTLVFTHKPVWNPYPFESEHNIAIPAASRDRLLAALAAVDVRSFGSGHLHHYALSTQVTPRGAATTVTAPATGFAGDASQVPGNGIAQQGIVEYRLEGRTMTPRFRSVEDLVEVWPLEIPEFTIALDALGATI